MGIKNRTLKGEIEKAYFQEFSLHYPLPAGNIIYLDKPDVIIDGPKKIGVEIAQLYVEKDSPTSKQRQRAMQINAVERAQGRFEKKFGQLIELTFEFDPNHPIDDVGNMADKLVTCAEKISPLPNGNVPKKHFEGVNEILRIHLTRGWDDCKWSALNLSHGVFLRRERLLDAIRQKELKVANYINCDEYWLLLVIEFMDLAQDQEIMNVDIGGIASSTFAKVIIFKTRFNQVLELDI